MMTFWLDQLHPFVKTKKAEWKKAAASILVALVTCLDTTCAQHNSSRRNCLTGMVSHSNSVWGLSSGSLAICATVWQAEKVKICPSTMLPAYIKEVSYVLCHIA